MDGTTISTTEFNSSIRSQIERQSAAIAMQLDDLDALAFPLESKPNRTKLEEKRLATIGEKRDQLRDLKAELRSTYLMNIAKLLRISELIDELDTISGGMEVEAKKPETLTKALNTADTIIKLGKSAIGLATKFTKS